MTYRGEANRARNPNIMKKLKVWPKSLVVTINNKLAGSRFNRRIPGRREEENNEGQEVYITDKHILPYLLLYLSVTKTYASFTTIIILQSL